jgi:hypothetical protein
LTWFQTSGDSVTGWVGFGSPLLLQLILEALGIGDQQHNHPSGLVEHFSQIDCNCPPSTAQLPFGEDHQDLVAKEFKRSHQSFVPKTT